MANREPRFMEHAVVVLVVPLIAIVLGCAVHAIAHALAWLGKTNERHWRVRIGAVETRS